MARGKSPVIAEYNTLENRKKVLVVDDEDCVTDTLGAVLEMRGFDVMEASSAEQARRVMEREGTPDLIVLDILLPGENGLNFCGQLRGDSQTSHIPVIMMTVVTQDTDLADGFWKLGTCADDFMTKPFDPFELARRVELLLGRSRRSRSSAS